MNEASHRSWSRYSFRESRAKWKLGWFSYRWN